MKARGCSQTWLLFCAIVLLFHGPAGSCLAQDRLAASEEQASALARDAEAACQQGKYSEAIRLYSAVEKLCPNRGSVFFGRGLAYEMANDRHRAEADYKKTLAVDPGNFKAMENLAGIWERSGRHIPETIELYRRALALDPRPEWQENLAAWIAMLETRLQPQESSAVGCWNLGNDKSDRGSDQEAEYYYSRSIELNPEMYQAYFSRGLLRARNGDLNGALTDFDHTVRMCPSLRGALVQRGLIQERMGKKDKTLEDFDRAARADPRDPEAHFHRGRALEQERYYAHALEAYLQALNLHPKPDLRAMIKERVSSVSAAATEGMKKDRRHSTDTDDLW